MEVSMRGLIRLLIVSGVAFAGMTSASMAQYYQRGTCNSWTQSCAQLYGGGGVNFTNCMRQPDAVVACRGRYGSGYVGNGINYGGGGTCRSWQTSCAQNYGWNNINWQNCMGQPGAIAACGGGGY
jgi:hypothetical protein